MRIPVRPRAAVLVAALVTALIVGIAFLTIPPMASAQPATVVAIVRTAPLTAAEKASRLTIARERAVLDQQAAARQRVAAARQAKVAKVQQLRSRIVQVAKKQIGDRYSAGSSGPSAFDCSGLTRYVYRVATGKELPHQSRAQYARVKKISRSNARPGDLVFFFRGGAHHVGVYIGNGRMVDAAGYGEGVRISPISGSWWSRTYSGMGRILPA